MGKKVLIVDDDVILRTNTQEELSEEGFTVFTAKDGEEGLDVYAKEKPDLIILDLGLPGMYGTDVCKQIRRKDTTTPIIVLTARDEEVNKVVNLEMGADDYVVKPFSVNELKARVRAILRRSSLKPSKKVGDEIVSFADVKLDFRKLKGYKYSTEFAISSKEMKLLKLLMEHDGEVVDRSVLIENVWGGSQTRVSRILDKYIEKLRQKIEDDPKNPVFIITVHGEGYQFNSKAKK